jgi:hypothetical protein
MAQNSSHVKVGEVILKQKKTIKTLTPPHIALFIGAQA